MIKAVKDIVRPFLAVLLLTAFVLFSFFASADCRYYTLAATSLLYFYLLVTILPAFYKTGRVRYIGWIRAFAILWSLANVLFVFGNYDFEPFVDRIWLCAIGVTLLPWAAIIYGCFFDVQNRRPVRGWLAVFLVSCLVAGWLACYAGQQVLLRQHARNLLTSRQQTLQIVNALKTYKQQFGAFPQTLQQLNLPLELAALPLGPLKYETNNKHYFSLSFEQPLSWGFRLPQSYNYFYLYIESQSLTFFDGWGTDPFKTIEQVDASLLPEDYHSQPEDEEEE